MSLLRTPRLVGRPITPRDARFAAALFGRPEVGRWTGEGAAGAPGERVRAFAAHWTAHGFGLRVWEREGRPAALAGLQFCVIAGRGAVEASFAVSPEHWGEGLGEEAMGAALAEAEGICREVVAVAHAENERAVRLLRRLGFAEAAGGEDGRRRFRLAA